MDWWTEASKEAEQSDYAQYVPRPTIGLTDSFFGIPTSSWYKKLDAWTEKVRELEYNAKQQQLAWDREDTQYQRLVEDMKKAGLNPYWLLANGTGSPVSTTSQQMSYGSSMTSKSEGKSPSANLLKTLGILVAIFKLLA